MPNTQVFALSYIINVCGPEEERHWDTCLSGGGKLVFTLGTQFLYLALRNRNGWIVDWGAGMPKLGLFLDSLKLDFPSTVICRVDRFGKNEETRMPS